MAGSVAVEDRVAVVSHAHTELGQHVKRLLLQRGFAEVRCLPAGGGKTVCQGADVVIDLAIERPDASATKEVLAACAEFGVGSIVACSDALVGFDPASDVTDGDEAPDASAGPAVGRLLALAKTELLLAQHADETTCSALVLRLHRVYAPAGGPVPSLGPLLLATVCGFFCGGGRAP